MITLNSSEPAVLEAAFYHDLILTEQRKIRKGMKFLAFEGGQWKVMRMAHDQITIPLWRCKNVEQAIYFFKRTK